MGSGLFLRSLFNVMALNTGFDSRNVVVVGIDPGAAGYQLDARLETMMDNVEARVSAIPGVQAASFACYVFNSGTWSDGVHVSDRDDLDTDPNVIHNVIGLQYFDAMKMPVILGRPINARDTEASRKVAVINETMARTYFAEGSPLGRTYGIGGHSPENEYVEVVGVVRDAKYEELDEEQQPAAFYPRYQQHGAGFLKYLVVRYTRDARLVFPEIQRAIRDVDADLGLSDFTPLAQSVEDSVLNRRLVAQLTALFGFLAVFLACIGIYGVMSYNVALRTNEFGLRMALGAERHQVVWSALRDTCHLAVAGVAIGLMGAIVASRFVESLLFGVTPYDPRTLGIAVFEMISVALFAGYVPARRAAKVDPLVALRHEG
jgi:predicted permease